MVVDGGVESARVVAVGVEHERLGGIHAAALGRLQEAFEGTVAELELLAREEEGRVARREFRGEGTHELHAAHAVADYHADAWVAAEGFGHRFGESAAEQELVERGRLQ